MPVLVCSSCGAASRDSAPARCPSCGASAAAFRPAELGPPETLEEARGRAREKLRNVCAVYPWCDGDRDRICQRENYGRAIGMGGVGLGRSFRANIEALDRVRLRMRVLGPHFAPDTRLSFLGLDLSMPIMGASTSGVSKYNDAIGEKEFCLAAIQGCLAAGTISWRGETAFYEYEGHYALEALEESEGRGIPIFKPRAQDVLVRMLRRAEAAGVPALGVDLDGAGSTNFTRAGKPVFRKTRDELAELVAATKLPFIAKGLMDADDADACVEAGARVIVVSNHGGRVLDSTPGTADVLPGIAARVAGRALVVADGGIRNGYDALKMLALGADAVLVGRDVIRAAIGGGAAAVRLQMERLGSTLAQAMLMCGAPDLASIGPETLAD